VSSRFALAAKLDRIRELDARLGWFAEASNIAGMRMLLDHAGLVVEPSAALGIAAILEDPDHIADRHVVTIVCGSNVNADAYHRWLGTAPTRRS
jgi:threonine dehydratase